MRNFSPSGKTCWMMLIGRSSSLDAKMLIHRRLVQGKPARTELPGGNIGGAVRSLLETGTPSTTPDTLAKLRAKHPVAQAVDGPDFDMGRLSSASPRITAAEVLTALHSFPKGTSGGPSGLTA